MYGSSKDIKHNLKLFFVDGIFSTPAMTMISVTTVIPFFLEEYGASTFQIGLAASLALICTVLTQPLFGSIASHTRLMHNTFAKILLLQRLVFLAFILSIPIFASDSGVLVWMFLVFWALFNVFAGSYSVFYTPLMLKLLPPDKRGTMRGLGYAAGNLLGMGMAALIPVILGSIPSPYDFVLIFSIGAVFLLINAILFLFMREHEDPEPRVPMSIVRYVKEMPSALRDNPAFRAMIATCTFLIAANPLQAYYTLYAIRVFSATESHVAFLAALAVISNAVGNVVFGPVTDRYGAVASIAIAALLIMSAGMLALVTNSLHLLYAAWSLSNLGSTCYGLSFSVLLGEASPSAKMPLYAGILTTISLTFSSMILLLLAPMLESVGFSALFATVFACGAVSLLMNKLILCKRIIRPRG